MTRKGFLAVLIAFALTVGGAYMLSAAPSPNATCGNVVCDAGCPAGFLSVGSGGVTARPMCINGSPATGCQYSLCNHRSTAVCAALDPFSTKQGCSSDAECGTGKVCVSSSGDPGCNTGFSQCMTLVTTTTTSTTTTTT